MYVAMNELRIKIDKPIYLHLLILEISKIYDYYNKLIYEYYLINYL